MKRGLKTIDMSNTSLRLRSWGLTRTYVTGKLSYYAYMDLNERTINVDFRCSSLLRHFRTCKRVQGAVVFVASFLKTDL